MGQGSRAWGTSKYPRDPDQRDGRWDGGGEQWNRASLCSFLPASPIQLACRVPLQSPLSWQPEEPEGTDEGCRSLVSWELYHQGVLTAIRSWPAVPSWILEPPAPGALTCIPQLRAINANTPFLY